MKKILITLAVLTAISCGSKEEKKESTINSTKNEPQKPAYMQHPDYAKGVELVRGSDCSTCHSEKTKIQGPSYEEIAKKYEATEQNIKLLAGKIIKGSSGTWGEVQMTAHPGLSQKDAEEMVKFVLLHK